ncbi:Protein of unknown function (DUF2892) [Chitinophaga japonensis]|uniref:Inner membrane protein YgaP-like transmembrane domain-containing protein n=2 Tax=Chitinophaga japonensis TaxID=104662 RepID=A0A562STE5_CHIJA|nr:Protein of unknown function (DUF2892) [Chitinophaga japonensis]
MGTIDRTVRIIIALLLAALYYGGIITGTTGAVLLVIGIVLFLTSVVGFCPLYGLLGIKTCGLKQE